MPCFLLNKPFRVLCQFTDSRDRPTLKDFVSDERVYPAGRLDYDSEGLVLLTDQGKLQARVSQPRGKLDKEYWVQVEGIAESRHVQRLTSGVELKDGLARASDVGVIPEPDRLWARDPPIRQWRNIPTSWLRLTLHEGRNRQVRRMTAAVGLPTLRLIRCRIGPWQLLSLQPGEYHQFSNASAWRNLAKYREDS